MNSISFGKIAFVLLAAIGGQWFLTDFVHFPGGGLGLFVAGLGVWWAFSPSKNGFSAPETVQGWVKRCKEVLGQFEPLEAPEKHLLSHEERSNALQEIIVKTEPQELAFISSKGVTLPPKEKIEFGLESSNLLNINYVKPLPLKDSSWLLPSSIIHKDLLVYFLPLPLRAADLLWLESIPENQPSWVMVAWSDSSSWPDQLNVLTSQLPERWHERILRWNGVQEDYRKILEPIRKVLAQPRKNLDQTKQRLLSRLHSLWQSDLETLRREKFSLIQNRSQWIVAGAVFASPVPSTDLLSVAVVNGLMIKEMADVWSCDMKPELLQVVARQLAAAAIAQGVVEWSGQTLLGLAKLHGGGWIAAGTMQALSAAYLTRVVGRSMADWMALNNGVNKPDLDLIKLQAPKLIEKAAKEEKVDWSGFLNQSKKWIIDQKNVINLQVT